MLSDVTFFADAVVGTNLASVGLPSADSREKSNAACTLGLPQADSPKVNQPSNWLWSDLWVGAGTGYGRIHRIRSTSGYDGFHLEVGHKASYDGPYASWGEQG